MKVVILAGGYGTRISEETHLRPKPMVEIGGKPILWHIMKTYSHYGLNDFIICLGYKGYIIKEYFANYFLHMSDVTIDFKDNSMEIHNNMAEPWKVTLVDTGQETMTGGRLKRIKKYIGNDDFCFTYGDGVANINIKKLIKFHKKNNTMATVSIIQPDARFGAINVAENKVTYFEEKPKGEGGWINGGFFVLSPKVFKLINGDETVWENEPLDTLAKEGQLSAFTHHGFWQAMDTLRDKSQLEELWKSNNAPWKVW
ncbi:glucose-1-phosphate cytidylyltransferase [sulfur-oxidizing endosymbiont of Gigantopelta aegis]|uniref:glucose-1-phosphate cytidylyltransferase n=1 Tax=sulfur-oxidizing endosymbiont of Gigantopelta aegis TaxID=2794934 RepID=UPI0018DBABB5|nr:glucose-1-phosphate cytidylyltransferase [sulfur-oxidizing endosymbiont of Gigantopelta aegis]